MLTLCASTLLLSLNWFTYIYAVSTNQVVEASLGYFLNPLVNVLIGVAILKEHMRLWQSASVLLAGVGVAMLGVPLIALTLALSFAFYGLLRKTVAVDGLLGLFVETLLLLPLALAYIVYLEATHSAAFVLADGADLRRVDGQRRRHRGAAAIVYGRRAAVAIFDARLFAIPGADDSIWPGRDAVRRADDGGKTLCFRLHLDGSGHLFVRFATILSAAAQRIAAARARGVGPGRPIISPEFLAVLPLDLFGPSGGPNRHATFDLAGGFSWSVFGGGNHASRSKQALHAACGRRVGVPCVALGQWISRLAAPSKPEGFRAMSQSASCL